MTNNNLTNTGVALALSQLGDGVDADTFPVVATGNTFTGSSQALSLGFMSGLRIAHTGMGIVLPNDGTLNQMVLPIFLADIDDTLIDGLNVAWTGSGMRTGTGISSQQFSDRVTIQNVNASNRSVGIQFLNSFGNSGGSDLTLTNNKLTNTGTGLFLAQISDGNDADSAGAALSCNLFSSSTVGASFADTFAILANNGFVGNGTGLVNATAVITINAENNWWNHPSGPSNLGGSGDSYSGNVDASSFLTSPPACLNLNTPPTITAEAALTPQQGSPTSAQQIATVSDADQAANTLTVTATPLSGSGVTVGTPSINAAGAVTANVQASCTATNSTFPLTVTDNQNAMATATLTVNVTANTPPTLSYANQTVGNALTINPASGPSDWQRRLHRRAESGHVHWPDLSQCSGRRFHLECRAPGHAHDHDSRNRQLQCAT